MATETGPIQADLRAARLKNIRKRHTVKVQRRESTSLSILDTLDSNEFEIGVFIPAHLRGSDEGRLLDAPFGVSDFKLLDTAAPRLKDVGEPGPDSWRAMNETRIYSALTGEKRHNFPFIPNRYWD